MTLNPVNDLRTFGELVPSPAHRSVKIGESYGLLTAVKFMGRMTSANDYIWLWQCACGNAIYVRSGSVRSGRTTSCGCALRRVLQERLTTHGRTFTSEYSIWCSMKDRCLNENSNSYHRYGGRGITVDPKWIESFEAFLGDMGPRPTKEHTLDRYNNNLGYSKENCRWTTADVQSSNRRSNLYVEYQGELMTATDFSRKIGCTGLRAISLLRSGRTPEEVAAIVASYGYAPRRQGARPTTSILTYEQMIERSRQLRTPSVARPREI